MSEPLDLAALRYYVGNPSAWDHYDEGLSKRIQAVVNIADELRAENAKLRERLRVVLMHVADLRAEEAQTERRTEIERLTKEIAVLRAQNADLGRALEIAARRIEADEKEPV